MSLIEAIIIGLVQGLTEFLPVSSSGHIELVKYFFGVQLEEGLLFTVLLHLATAFSTVIVFRKDLLLILKGLLQFKWNEETRFSLFVIISMIPAAFIGLFFEDQIDNYFIENIPLVCAMLVVTGVILFASDRSKTTGRSLDFKSATAIGIVQAIAILPGISRSGSTIGSSILMGINREKAARFSFLMVIPLIFGAAVKKFLDFQEAGGITENVKAELEPMMIGFVAALISGIFACRWMIQLVKKSRLTWFAIYCWVVASASLLYYYLA
jgi:undecaprenyl-diphosphatase